MKQPKPIALIKVHQEIDSDQLKALHASIIKRLDEDYHVITVTTLEELDMQIEVHSVNNVEETTLEELRNYIKELHEEMHQG